MVYYTSSSSACVLYRLEGVPGEPRERAQCSQPLTVLVQEGERSVRNGSPGRTRAIRLRREGHGRRMKGGGGTERGKRQGGGAEQPRKGNERNASAEIKGRAH